MADLDEEARRTGDRIQQRLAERFERLSVPNEIRRLEGTMSELLRLVASEARWGDIFVASRPHGEIGASQWGDLFEIVLFQGGRSIYAVPPERPEPNTVRRVLLAWQDSREAARAAAEAAPLIAEAARTEIVLVNPSGGTPANRSEPATDIARHLARHGTEVEVEVVMDHDRAVSEIILDQARRMSADLIVMGAYGHSRAREWVLGGATREMLENSEFPILMAH